MLKLPPAILSYIQTLVVENRSPAYLLVAKDGSLLQWGGSLAAYGITHLSPGDHVGESILFLQEVLPIDDSSVLLPCIKTECGLTADVHIFSGDEGDWILLLDATQEENQRLPVQQKNNDLSLVWQKQFKLIDQCLKPEVMEIPSELLTFQMIGEYKEITILSIEIRKIFSEEQRNSTQILFNTLNLYLLTIVESILKECGTVSSIFGDTITALFGIIPTAEQIPQSAIRVAFKILEAVRELGQTQHNNNLPIFDISVGIASGDVLLGILHNKQYQKINAIGAPVNLALHLNKYASSGEILIDETTFHQLAQMQQHFSECTFLDKDINNIKTYSCLLQ